MAGGLTLPNSFHFVDTNVSLVAYTTVKTVNRTYSVEIIGSVVGQVDTNKTTAIVNIWNTNLAAPEFILAPSDIDVIAGRSYSMSLPSIIDKDGDDYSLSYFLGSASSFV